MSQLAALAAKLFNPNQEFRPKIVDSERRIRGVLDGKDIFDTTSAKLVWEHEWFPQYWIPNSAFVKEAQFTADKPVSGIQSSTSKLQVGTGKSVSTLLVPDSFNSELAGYVKINFKDLDGWYEELSPVLFHPKDPWHRVDILPTARQIRVELDDQVLADTGSDGGVMSLWETNFPGRWYLPRAAVKGDFLKPSDTRTGCPYKGEAKYYNAVVNGKEHKDVVWYYDDPLHESAAIRDLLCFYPDKVTTFVDGVPIQKIGMPAKPHFHQHQSKAENEKENDGNTTSCNC